MVVCSFYSDSCFAVLGFSPVTYCLTAVNIRFWRWRQGGMPCHSCFCSFEVECFSVVVSFSVANFFIVESCVMVVDCFIVVRCIAVVGNGIVISGDQCGSNRHWGIWRTEHLAMWDFLTCKVTGRTIYCGKVVTTIVKANICRCVSCISVTFVISPTFLLA